MHFGLPKTAHLAKAQASSSQAARLHTLRGQQRDRPLLVGVGMPSHPSIDHDGPAAGEAVSRLLREAKRLQRAAMSDSLAASLPVLRRLLASGSIPPASVPQAFRERQKLQRKHFLRTLAVEANFESWEECRATLALAKNSEPERAAALWRDPGQLNLWFGTVAEAAAFASTHGGNIVRVGRHAVVLPIHGELAGRSRA